MSYILEALRRAERERHLGQVPTVQTLAHTSSSQDRVPWWRTSRLALIAIVALLMATAFLLWRKPLSDAPATAPATDTVGTPPVAATAEPAPAAVAPVPAPTEPPSAPTRSLAPLATGQPLQAAVEAAEAAEVIADEEGLSSLDDLATPFAAAPDTASSEVAPRRPAPPSPEPESEPATASARPAPSPAAQPMPEPPLLRDMPSSYRARFPSVRMDVHVYNDDPSRRWIMVDGRRYGEGDALASGPRVVAIRVEGVIFEHAGQRVMLPLTR